MNLGCGAVNLKGKFERSVALGFGARVRVMVVASSSLPSLKDVGITALIDVSKGQGASPAEVKAVPDEGALLPCWLCAGQEALPDL